MKDMDRAALLAEAQRRGLIPAQGQAAPTSIPIPPSTIPTAASVGSDKEALRQEAIRRGLITDNQPKTSTTEDFATGATTGFLKLPTAAFQSALDVAAGLTDPNQQGLVMKGIGALLSNAPGLSPEAEAKLKGLTIANAREAFAGRAKGLEQAQQQAEESSPIAATVGNVVGNIAPLMALGAVTGGAVGGALQPQQQVLSPSEALKERAIGTGTGATLGYVGDKALKIGAKALPVVAEKTAGALRSGAEKLAGINKAAAKDFADQEIQVSLAALTDSPAIKLFDRFISKFPGGAGKIAENTSKTLDDIQLNLRKLGADKGATTQQAGQIIREGGERYVDKFNQVANRLYDKVDKYIPMNNRVEAPNVISLLEQEAQKIRSPNLKKRISSNESFKLLSDIAEDASSGQMTYQSLKEWRTLVGKKLAKRHLLSDQDDALMETVYSKLSDDMLAQAQKEGPAAVKAFERANKFYREGATNIQGRLQNILKKGTDEEVFTAAMQGTKEGGTKINQIMRALPGEDREIVRGTVLNKLGKKNAEGEFSTRTYLTEWNKLSPEAKNALFGSSSPMRTSLDRLARITTKINEIDRFANPSGTAQALATGALIGGSFWNLPLAAKSVIGANVGARLMTNQNFVKWLADTSAKKSSPGIISKQLNRLTQVAKNNPEIADDIAKYVALLGSVSGTKTLTSQEKQTQGE